MRKDQVIEALHAGMATAVREFHAWTDGESIKDWGVESVLTTACARTLTARGSGALLTLEQDFGGILKFSGRRRPRGRPSTADSKVSDKAQGRVDIVLWNKAGTPRAVIEVKRADGAAGLAEDAARVAGFIKAAGQMLGGSVRYGAVATVLDAPSERPQNLQLKAKRRRDKLEAFAVKEGLDFVCSGPRSVPDPHAERERRAATLVFLFSARAS